MKLSNKERGARVRRNLRRWWKRLLWMTAGWMLLSAVVYGSALFYAHAHHFSPRRVRALGESCGLVMGGVLIAAGLTVLVLADRRPSE